MENLDLGRRIKDLRLKLGMSQEELAEQSGLTARTVQRIEGGQTAPRGDSLKRIAGALEVDMAELTNKEADSYHQTALGNKHPSFEARGAAEGEYASLGLNPNPRPATVMIISAFAYFLFPLLGLIFPGVIYLMYKNSNPLVKKFGVKILYVESVYCLILGLFYGVVIAGRFWHNEMPEIIPFKTWLLLLATSYLVNAGSIAVILIRLIKSTKGLWAPFGTTGSLQ